MRDYIKISSSIDPMKDAKFFKSDGTELKGVRSCDIRLRKDEICTAKIDLIIENIDIETEPLLSFDNVCVAARHYGYDLIPIQKDKNG